MIITVTLNPALDVTYRSPAMTPGGSHRVALCWERAGGKGVNVARIASAFGFGVRALGFAGGPTGEALVSELSATGIRGQFVPIRGATRRTVTVIDDEGRATAFNEYGPAVSEAEFAMFREVLGGFLRSAQVLVLSGSLPVGLPSDAYATLVRDARALGVPSIVDTSGPALPAALSAGPSLVKPNLDELVEVTGLSEVDAASSALLNLGADAVAASLGPEGIALSTGTEVLRLAPPPCEVVNPTGAGDAAVAAFASGFAERVSWPEMLARAVAWSAAAVSEPVAGSVDPSCAAELASALKEA